MYLLRRGLGKIITIVFVAISFCHGCCAAAQQSFVDKKRISHQRGYSAGSLDKFSFQLRMTVDLHNLRLVLDAHQDFESDQTVIVDQPERDIHVALDIIWQLYRHIFYLTNLSKKGVLLCFPERKEQVHEETIELIKYIKTDCLAEWCSLLGLEIMMPLTQLIDDFLTLHKPFGVQELSY